MTNNTTKATEKNQQDADQILSAVLELERTVRALKQRAKWLRAGRSVAATQGPGADLSWAAADLRQGTANAARVFEGVEP